MRWVPKGKSYFSRFWALKHSIQNSLFSVRGNFLKHSGLFSAFFMQKTAVKAWKANQMKKHIFCWGALHIDLEAEESASHPTLLPCLSKGGAARFKICSNASFQCSVFQSRLILRRCLLSIIVWLQFNLCVSSTFSYAGSGARAFVRPLSGLYKALYGPYEAFIRPLKAL